MAIRDQLLDAARSFRDGRRRTRRLDDGEVQFLIPESDFKVLTTIYPDLVHTDHTRREAAWQEFRQSPIAEQYFVQRPPARVKRSHANRIIVK